jgi:hypothetical protein
MRTAESCALCRRHRRWITARRRHNARRRPSRHDACANRGRLSRCAVHAGRRPRRCDHLLLRRTSAEQDVLTRVAPEAKFANKAGLVGATNPKLPFDIMAVPRGVEPPTFGLGNRSTHRYFNSLRRNVANVLHPFPRREILQHIFARADDLPAQCPLLSVATVHGTSPN